MDINTLRPSIYTVEHDSCKIEGIYVSEIKPFVLQWTIVWTSEIWPYKDKRAQTLINNIYTKYRKVHYRREQDIESFIIIYNKDWLVERIELDNVYSANNSWGRLKQVHHDKTYLRDGISFEPNSERPKIWITTWNHLMDCMPRQKYSSVLTDYTCILEHSRDDVEKLYKEVSLYKCILPKSGSGSCC